jgi:very-short-patch-repair endonuclease
MNVRLRELAARQYDVVAAWQLVEAGWTRRMIDHRLTHHGWRVVHHGVYALNRAPPTQLQLWTAATLTAPSTVLSHGSAAACWGFRPWPGGFETVTRAGSGGPKRHGDVLVCRSTMLEGEVTRNHGILITTAPRTLIDLTGQLDTTAIGRAFREALRLGPATVEGLLSSLARHRGRRGIAPLGELAKRYAHLPYRRARSDAEVLALQVLQDAGLQSPRLNIRVAGQEADLVWPDRRLIIEIDGPQYHRFADVDARKQRRWEDAGYTVRRIPSGVVYDQPTRLIALARPANPGRTCVSPPPAVVY